MNEALLKDFETVLMAAKAEAERIRTDRAEIETETAELEEQKYIKPRDTMRKLHAILKSAVGDEESYVLHVPFETEEGLKEIKFWSSQTYLGHISCTVFNHYPDLRFDSPRYAQFIKHMDGSAQRKSIDKLCASDLVLNWDKYEADFVKAFMDAMTTYMADKIDKEQKDLDSARAKRNAWKN